MWILVIEDEKRLSDVLRRGLESEGYTVDLAHDGRAGEDMARVNGYDAMIVDWRLPGRDGRAVIASLREDGIVTPAIMLTALDDVEHRVAGLNAGADDYLSKPFSFEELIARLRAVLRRPPLSAQDRNLSLGPLTMDTERRNVVVGETEIILRPKEFAVLEILLRQAGAVLSRSVLAERVWGSALYVSDNVIDVTISGLRQKLKSAGSGGIELETVRGVGYRLREIDPASA
ncbi:MAG: response regulator transcription factor [Rhodothermales bacterium]|nr:response regulator transcription factor [Rhodothermales bacterium]